MRLVRLTLALLAAIALAGPSYAQSSRPSDSTAKKSRTLAPGTGTGSSHKGGHYITLPPGSSIRPPALKVPAPPTPRTAKPPKPPKPPKEPKDKLSRSEKAKRDFYKQTGHPNGWPGHVVDHIVPLACGGADSPSNMQWQTTAEAKAKDKVERIGCGRP